MGVYYDLPKVQACKALSFSFGMSNIFPLSFYYITYLQITLANARPCGSASTFWLLLLSFILNHTHILLLTKCSANCILKKEISQGMGY